MTDFLGAESTAVEDALPYLGPVVAGVCGFVIVTSADARSAVWTLSPTGEPVGAWVFDKADIDRRQALELVSVMERRVLLTVPATRDETEGVVADLAASASRVAPKSWLAAGLDLAAAPGDIQSVRDQLTTAVADQRRNTGSRLAELLFSYDVPETTHLRTLPALMSAANARPISAPTAAASIALDTSRYFKTLMRVWNDTEVARLRRKYLRPLGGPESRPLPEAWMTLHQHVVDTRFDATD